MSNTIRALLATVMVALMMVVVPTTANAAPASVSAPTFWGETVCYHRYRWEQDHWNDGTKGADEWWMKVKHYYLYCEVEGQPDYVIMKQSVYRYDFEGTSQDCRTWTGVNRMGSAHWNSYFFDMVGRNFNPPKVTMECSGTSTRTMKIFYDDAPRLYTVDGEPPKFKTNWDVVIVGLVTNHVHYGILGGYLRKCNGRGFHVC